MRIFAAILLALGCLAGRAIVLDSPPDQRAGVPEVFFKTRLMAYYACEQKASSAYLTNAIGTNDLNRIGVRAWFNDGIVGKALQVTTSADPTYSLAYPWGTFCDFTNSYCIRLWFFYDAATGTDGGTDDILRTYHASISYVLADKIRFQSNLRSATPVVVDSAALTPNAWNRIVVWHQNGKAAGIIINNGAAVTVADSHPLDIGTNDGPGLIIVAPRIGVPTDTRIDEIAIWDGYIPNAAELLWDWNNGAGRTHPF